MRYALGSKKRRCLGELPAPGPPCRNTAGIPFGLPHSSQYIERIASSRSIPLARGSISGNSAVTGAPPRSGDEDDRPRRLARVEVAVRLHGILEGVLVGHLDLHLARLHETAQVR